MSSQETKQNLSSDARFVEPSSDLPLPSSPSPIKEDKRPLEGIDQKEGEATSTQDAPKSPAAKPLNPRLTALATKQASLEAKLADLQAQRAAMVAEVTPPSGLDMPPDWSEEQRSQHALADASSVIKEHIALLHGYNEMKDIGQGLMGLVADKRGVRIATVMEEFEMSEKD